jgi:WD40 repeat protein
VRSALPAPSSGHGTRGYQVNARNDRLAEDVLRAAVAAWQAPLSAAYFDPEAKQRVLDEVRAGVAAQAPDLPAHELAGLQDRVIAHLLGTASRDAPPPAGDAAPAAAEDIEERIVTTYPYPVARPYSALTEKERPMEAFGGLMDAFESLVHFLATVAVSAYLRSGRSVAECDRHLLDKFLKGVWSTGDLYALLRDTVRLAGDCGGRLPYAELPPYLFTPRGKPTASNQVLGAFVTLRNRAWAHATGRDEAFYADILPANLARLRGELARAAWLIGWELIRPVQIDPAGRVTRADVLMGNWRRKARPYELAVGAEDLEGHGGPVRAEKSLLLVAPDRDRYLPLFPLSLFHFQLSAQGVYFLQRLEWQPARDARKVRRAAYVAYESELRDHEESPGDLAARILEQHIRRLETALGRVEHTGAEPADPAGPPPDPDHELAEVCHEQAFHLRTFAGRERLLQSLGGWIERSDQGGYLLLLGPPGQGKSALMAALARSEGERHGCLLHMVKAHRNPLKFLPSLVSQAVKLTEARFGPDAYQGDVDDLRNALVRALEAVVARRGRAVVVLDALDELAPSDGRVDFLPPALPAGVRAVLTCRPDIPLVQALRSRLRDLEEWDLPPLSEEDLPPILERRLAGAAGTGLNDLLDWKELFRRLQGNPLFLQRALDRVGKALEQARSAGAPPRIDLEALPATLDALFQDIYGEIAEREGTRSRTPEGRQKARLLHLLCLTREPLGLEALAGLMAAADLPLSLEDCRDRVLEMSQYLLDTGGERFKPWHQGLADYVVGRVLGASGCRQAEAAYCAWLRRPEARSAPYRLRYHAQHLLAAERFDEMADLLTELPFLEARAAAGQVFDLAADFGDAVLRLPADHPRRPVVRLLGEALRADVHFIARHPSTLFQCLWNSCWWYDCPEAERHYEPPPGGWPPEGPPWRQPGPRLSALLEAWRAAKERAEPGFRWLRSLRPPPVHLGTAQLAVFRGHEGPVTSVACSPDGRLIVSGAYDHAVHLWEAGTGNLLARLTGHADSVTGVAFAPDGRLLVSGSSDGTLRLWDVEGAREVVCLRGHGAEVRCVAFAPDGQRVASGSWDQTARVWGVPGGAQQAAFAVPDYVVRSVAFSPDGRRLAGASSQVVHVWDVPGGGELFRLYGHVGSVWSVAFSPDGRRIATGAADRTVRLWDASNGEQLACFQMPDAVGFPTRRHFSAVLSVAWSPDGRLVASGSPDQAVRVWGRPGGPVAELRGHTGGVPAVAFTADGRRIVSGSGDGTVRVWHAGGGRALALLSGHQGQVTSVRVAARGERLLSYGKDVTLRLWDARTGEEIAHLRGEDDYYTLDHPDWRGDVSSPVCESPDGWRIVFKAGERSGRPGKYLVWDLRRGGVTDLFGDDIVQFVHEGRWVVTTSNTDNAVRVWHLEAGREVASFPAPAGTWDIAAVSPDGGRFLSRAAGESGEVYEVWGVEARCVHVRLGGLAGPAVQFRFSPDGRRVLGMADARQTLCVWGAEHGGEPLRLRGGQPVISATFSPDGGYILARYLDRAARVWDAQTGAELIHLPGAAGRVWNLDFTRDGRRFLAVASDDTAIQVWDLPTGERRSCFRQYPSRMYCVELSEDGRYVVSSEYDQTIRVWDVDTGSELASRHEPGLIGSTVALLPEGQGVGFLVEGRQRLVWDFRGGVCRVADGAAASALWQAVDAGAETQIVAADTGAEVAWFPLKLWHIVGHPDGRTWAGAAGNHLYLFKLEGGEDATAAGTHALPPSRARRSE